MPLLAVTPCALATQARNEGELGCLTAGSLDDDDIFPAVLPDVPPAVCLPLAPGRRPVLGWATCLECMTPHPRPYLPRSVFGPRV